MQVFIFSSVPFQSTPPCGGDVGSLVPRLTSPKFQSTPPYGGDEIHLYSIFICIISIHAPIRGRPIRHPASRLSRLFQSTPPCGGDVHLFDPHPVPGDFNPRPLAGATSQSKRHGLRTGNFNPRPLAGATIMTAMRRLALARFQSTPPCGGDRQTAKKRQKNYNFNPRPLAGATVCLCRAFRVIAISIHAPLRGRLPRSTKQFFGGLFQSTPPCGGDAMPEPSWGPTPDFNPRPLAGATTSFQEAAAVDPFQSTPPCGGDRRNMWPNIRKP